MMSLYVGPGECNALFITNAGETHSIKHRFLNFCKYFNSFHRVVSSQNLASNLTNIQENYFQLTGRELEHVKRGKMRNIKVAT